MKVTLYRYVGDSDTANKILKNCTVVYDKEVIPYGSFNPNGASFRLDTLHDVNYAKFTYNSHDYYGYVDVSTDSKGIYTYSITTDPLTTAWYAGCFNTGNKCLYSDSGSNLLFDGRAKYEDYVNKSIVQLADFSNSDYDVIMVVRSAVVSPTSTMPQNAAFNTYWFTFGTFYNFYLSLLDKDDAWQKKYVPSIVALYMVPHNSINSSLFGSPVDDSVSLTAMAGSTTKSDDITVIVDTPEPSSGSVQIHYTTRIMFVTLTNQDYSQYVSTTLNYPLTSTRQKTSFKLHVFGCGDFNFTYADVSNGQSITNIGYRIAYDFIGGTQTAYLVVNDVIKKDYCIQAQIPLMFPINYDSSIVRSDRLISGLLSSGISMYTSVATIKPSNVIQTIGNVAQQGINAANQIMDYNFDVNNGAQSTVGSLGNTTELVTKYGSYLTITEMVPHNLADIQAKFGKPDGLVRVVGNLTGWVQTEACHLPSNGLAFNIVTQAEVASNVGFRIVV